MPAPFRAVRLGPDRRDEIIRLDQTAFAMTDEELDHELAYVEWDRTAGVLADPDDPASPLVGIDTVFSMGISVPDGPGGAATRAVPMAGLSWVGVDPTYRRRGVLRELMRDHLHGLHEDGRESVSGLFASEPTIYGRFGYGCAISSLSLELSHGTALRPVPGSDDVELQFVAADVERHVDLVTEVYDRACARRPGMVARNAALSRRQLADSPSRRRGREPLRLLMARSGGRLSGYALLRREMRWVDGTPSGSAQLDEVVALDAATARALWSRLTDLDLVAVTHTPPLAADDALLSLLENTRPTRAMRRDGLWLRLVDVDRALAQRTYAHEVDLVLAVTDGLCPWNARRWRLAGGPQSASCEPTPDDPDVVLDVRELAAAYVGGVPLAALAAAGLVTECTPGAVARLSTALRAAVDPAPSFFF